MTRDEALNEGIRGADDAIALLTVIRRELEHEEARVVSIIQERIERTKTAICALYNEGAGK